MSKERKYLLIAALILLPLAVVYRFFPSVGGLDPVGEEIAMKEKQIRKYHQILQESQNLEKNAEALNRLFAQGESRLLAGGTPALAAVDIQNLINEISAGVGVEVASMRVIPASDKEKERFLVKVPIAIRFTATIGQLKKWVFKMENAPKLLRITQFRARVENPVKTETLQVEMTIEGFMKRGEA